MCQTEDYPPQRDSSLHHPATEPMPSFRDFTKLNRLRLKDAILLGKTSRWLPNWLGSKSAAFTHLVEMCPLNLKIFRHYT